MWRKYSDGIFTCESGAEEMNGRYYFVFHIFKNDKLVAKGITNFQLTVNDLRKLLQDKRGQLEKI